MQKFRRTFHEIETFQEWIKSGIYFDGCCFQSIDFTGIKIEWKHLQLHNCVFLGCKLDSGDESYLRKKDCLFFPILSSWPYNPYRSQLYTWKELYTQQNGITWDENTYLHFERNKYADNILESLYQRIHDHAIDDALYELLERNKDGSYGRKIVAMMGGHSTKRSQQSYRQAANVAYLLSKNEYLVCSGGGPGIMEAVNLGAYMGAYPYEELEKVLDKLHSDINYHHPDYYPSALQVLKEYSHGHKNLAIPTWFYGHEPSNLFASHIAKYFSNSIREDTLLAIATSGVIFAPGSAGTHQEIFMDLAQNHYKTFEYESPMVFLGTEHYGSNGIYQVVKDFAEGRSYADLIKLTDDPVEALRWINNYQLSQ